MPYIDRDRITYRKRPTGKWEVIYYVIDGSTKTRRFKGGFDTRNHASIWLRDIEDELSAGKTNDVTYQAFKAKYLATRKRHKQDSSIEQDRISLDAFGDSIPIRTRLSEITSYHIEDFLAGRCDKKGRQVGQYTLARDLRTLKTAFKTAIKWGHITDNPAGEIPRIIPDESEIRYLTVDQQCTLLSAAREMASVTLHRSSVDTPYIYPLIALALRTGMRKGELLNLRWQSVDIAGQRIHIENQSRRNQDVTKWRTKTGRVRVVPIDDPAITALNWWREWFTTEIAVAIDTIRTTTHQQTRDRAEYRLSILTRCQESPYVFPSFDDPMRPLGAFQKPWERVRRQANTDIRFHDLRHTFAVMCAFAGVPIALLSQLLGHSEIEMTQKYLRFYTDDAASRVSLPPLSIEK